MLKEPARDSVNAQPGDSRPTTTLNEKEIIIADTTADATDQLMTTNQGVKISNDL